MIQKNIEVKSFADFRKKVASSETIKREFTKDPIKFMNEVSDKSPMEDKFVFLKIVYIVGAALLLCIIVSTVISIWSPIIEYTNLEGKIIREKREIDSFFIMIASASIGALAGLLVPTPNNK
ncbi:hypothetical protein [Flavivirga eckloniae]|uniref:Uncharacterized protein n=1 Tax=Flavivirga eckloniae TaxID=1803846 RepID=A0A2K9PVC7_9FLAO|nr:hypothetical protein [Flavivirga eckloniae]AUP81014.1 hypothetical protein C1H87_20770 [Flavivirga eckloniae]